MNKNCSIQYHNRIVLFPTIAFKGNFQRNAYCYPNIYRIGSICEKNIIKSCDLVENAPKVDRALNFESSEISNNKIRCLFYFIEYHDFTFK